MYQLGLVSISFRPLTAEQVVKAAADAGLTCIEWGSDVHAPCDDRESLHRIVQLQKQYGISCCSYGTYFRLGINPAEELPAYIRAAKALGTDTLRLWAGKKSPWDFTAEEKDKLFADSKTAAKMAEEAGVTLCLECHMKTYTETAETALELLQAVDSPAFRMYWQPNQKRTLQENLENARALKDYVNHIHVFHWKQRERYPLAEGIEEWKTYLAQFTGDRHLLLEFMPDDEVTSLKTEATALHELAEK